MDLDPDGFPMDAMLVLTFCFLQISPGLWKDHARTFDSYEQWAIAEFAEATGKELNSQVQQKEQKEQRVGRHGKAAWKETKMKKIGLARLEGTFL